jgi:hypothetical protein
LEYISAAAAHDSGRDYRSSACARAAPKEADSEILQDLLGGAIIYHLLVRPGYKNQKDMRAHLLLHQLGLSPDQCRKSLIEDRDRYATPGALRGRRANPALKVAT